MQAQKASSSSSISLLNALKIIEVDCGNSERCTHVASAREFNGRTVGRHIAFETLVTIIIANRATFALALFHAALLRHLIIT